MGRGVNIETLKLTPIQKRAFRKLVKARGWVSPYDIQESINTLDSLFRRGLVNRKYELGSMADPRTGTYYKSKYRSASGKGKRGIG